MLARTHFRAICPAFDARRVADRVLLPVPSDPTISFRLWFKVGSQDDPPGKEGLAAITAAMIAEGATRANSYEQILDKLLPLAAGYSASPSVEMTVISGRVHKDNLDRFYPLLIEAVREPAFKQEDLDRIKSPNAQLSAKHAPLFERRGVGQGRALQQRSSPARRTVICPRERSKACAASRSTT